MATDLGGEASAEAYVYGLLYESIIVLRRGDAERLAGIWRASRQASTWGEFRALLDDQSRAELLERHQWFGPDNEVIEDSSPPDGEPFESIQVSVAGWGDSGGWPEWPAAKMLYELPEAVRARVGRGTTSMLSGDSYEIRPSEEAELVAAFRDLGLPLSRDDRLVEEASGY